MATAASLGSIGPGLYSRVMKRSALRLARAASQ
jgi:hypothetical protein